MKTILYIGGFELPDKNAAAHRVLSNAKSFRELGYNTILVGVNKGVNKTLLNKYTVQGFDAYDIKYPSSGMEWFSFSSSIKYYKTLIKKHSPNAIIAYNLPAIQLYKLTKIKGLKVFADVTEWYAPSGNLLFRVAKGFDVNLRMKYIQPKLDGLIVISEFLEKYYQKRGVKNLINIPPLVDTEDNKWKLSADNDNSGTLKFVYSGSPGKGGKDSLDLVVESLKDLHIQNENIRLKVVGITKDFYTKYFNNDKDLSKEYNFIEFMGRVSHEESIKSIQTSDFFIFFRDNNLINTAGFPTKFVESITAGTPVITNTSSNLKQYFEDKEVGFIIDDLNAESISSILNNITKLDKETLSRYKEFCYNSKMFDYRKYNKEIQSLIKDIR